MKNFPIAFKFSYNFLKKLDKLRLLKKKNTKTHFRKETHLQNYNKITPLH